MPKTIVNIITEDNPIPAYLFIKEMYDEGDRLMYISAWTILMRCRNYSMFRQRR